MHNCDTAGTSQYSTVPMRVGVEDDVEGHGDGHQHNEDEAVQQTNKPSAVVVHNVNCNSCDLVSLGLASQAASAAPSRRQVATGSR